MIDFKNIEIRFGDFIAIPDLRENSLLCWGLQDVEKQLL